MKGNCEKANRSYLDGRENRKRRRSVERIKADEIIYRGAGTTAAITNVTARLDDSWAVQCSVA